MAGEVLEAALETPGPWAGRGAGETGELDRRPVQAWVHKPREGGGRDQPGQMWPRQWRGEHWEVTVGFNSTQGRRSVTQEQLPL